MSHPARILFFGFLVLFGVTSCRKKEIEEITIPGNRALPDTSISPLVSENYVNKVYISVLGRKPSSVEFESGDSILDAHGFSTTGRNLLLDKVLNEPEFFAHHYGISRVDLLNDLDTNEVANYIGIFNILLLDSTYVASWELLEYEISRLEEIQGISSGLLNGNMDIIDMHRRCVNNYFYDQINMGSENFVVSLWQNFLFRYPTDAELSQGVKMNDGLGGFVFSQDGYSKSDLLDIFFSSDEYFEGQVRDLTKRFLFREPTSVEMTELAALYKSSGSFKALQKAILSGDEYSGIE